MTRIAVCAMLAVAGLAACEYEAPLTADHTIAIDRTALGLWELDGEQLLILPFSGTEYAVHYPMKNDPVYWRAYPIEVGGKACVQVEAIGTGDGPVPADERGRFHVVSYDLDGDKLVLRTLNTDLVSKRLASTEALREAFITHKDDENLFTNPGVFTRVKH